MKQRLIRSHFFYALSHAGIAWGFILNMIIFPRLDVDTYHDGFIYPMALSASRGAVPYKDFFSSYGPVVPIIQGHWIKLFGENLLALRIHGGFLISLIAVILYLLLRPVWGLRLSLIIVSIWMVGNPLIMQQIGRAHV